MALLRAVRRPTCRPSTLTPFIWGYGHLLVFASVAPTGAGLQVALDYEIAESQLSATTAGLALAAPIALYLTSLWLLQSSDHRNSLLSASIPLAGMLAIVIVAVGLPVELIAVVVAGLVGLLAVRKGR